MSNATTSRKREKKQSENNTLGGRLQTIRNAKNLTVEQLARRTGVIGKTLTNWETDRSEPRGNKLQMLAGVLGVPANWLLYGDESLFNSDALESTNETSGMEKKIEQLLKLHEESAKLIIDLETDIRRLQLENNI